MYSIGLLFDNEAGESQQATNDLERLSRETGGVAYFARSLGDVNIIAAEVARDIREQYVVDYHSSKPFTQGGYRSVRVEATSPREGPMVVRTKRGYYPEDRGEEPSRCRTPGNEKVLGCGVASHGRSAAQFKGGRQFGGGPVFPGHEEHGLPVLA